MFDLIVQLVRGLFEANDASHLREAVVRAYDRAWQNRIRSGGTSVEILLAEVRRVAPEKDESNDPLLREAVSCWERGLDPTATRETLAR